MREGIGVIACNAALGSVSPIYTKGATLYYMGVLQGAARLGWVFGVGRSGTVPALAGRLGEGGAFALCARDWGDRLQCSLRSGPAAPGVCGWVVKKGR